MIGIGILVLLVATVAIGISMYNSLVRLRAQVKNAWSQIDVQLKRRYDLIPNLVETVKGYATHEQETFKKVVEARSSAMKATNISEKGKQEGMLTEALKSLFALSEGYPDLKANQNFLQLQEELSSTENKIAFARQFYNDSVMSFNVSCETFPSNLIAGFFSFKQEAFFETGEEVKEPPKVRFN